MAVTLAAARRLCAIHHRLKPTGHVHLQHLVTPDETMLLVEADGQRHTERWRQFSYISALGNCCYSGNCSLRLVTYQQLVVFWPFSVILCEAEERHAHEVKLQ